MPAPYWTVLDDAGVSIPGGLLEFFASGTSTHQPAYADADLTVPLANPASADSAGRLVAYLSATNYKVVVKTAAGVTIRTVDPVTAIGASGSGLVGAALGEVFLFGGESASPVTAAAYPSGATFDKLHAGTGVMLLDSGNLAAGTYVLQATGIVDSAVTLTVAIVNLSDGNPDVALAEATITSTTGAVGTSGVITFPPAGATKSYGIKAKISGGSGEAWGIRLVRQA